MIIACSWQDWQLNHVLVSAGCCSTKYLRHFVKGHSVEIQISLFLAAVLFVSEVVNGDQQSYSVAASRLVLHPGLNSIIVGLKQVVVRHIAPVEASVLGPNTFTLCGNVLAVVAFVLVLAY